MMAVLRWLGRQTIVYLALIVAILFATIALPIVRDKWLEPGKLDGELATLSSTLAKVEASSKSAEQKLDSAKQAAVRLGKRTDKRSRAKLRNRQMRLQTSQGILDERLSKTPNLFDRLSPDKIIARKKDQLQQSANSIELNAITLALKASLQRERISDKQNALDKLRAPSDKRLSQLKRVHASKLKELQVFDQQKPIERLPREYIFRERSPLKKAELQARSAYDEARLRRDKWDRGQADIEKALDQLKAKDAGVRATVADVTQDIRAEIDKREALRGGTLRGIIENKAKEWRLTDIALKAALLLAVIIASPFLIRIMFYYLLAPLAARRASIKVVVPGGGGVPIPRSAPSRVSIPVTLGSREELLVRQDYLQTSSLTATKSTRWLLDYRHPISSIATGLTFLTRVRGEGEATTVSAVRDAFAELAEVVLPEGAACVLHPRALVAVVQPFRKTIRITSHWRLLTLNAWLTLQLRYLVFHGPGRLIVKGGRGVRVEPAERGRIFGQDQLVGFSADLAYSVTRTETFGPYFFGREQLFKDKVERGSGILIIEEAPLAGKKGNGVRKGLEGAFDAGMKAFGM